MNGLEYQATVMGIKIIYGPEGFENFIQNGVNQAKNIIIKALTEKPAGLSFLELNNLVKESFSNERWETAIWKTDAFLVAIAGLELEDKKIKNELGIYTLTK